MIYRTWFFGVTGDTEPVKSQAELTCPNGNLAASTAFPFPSGIHLLPAASF